MSLSDEASESVSICEAGLHLAHGWRAAGGQGQCDQSQASLKHLLLLEVQSGQHIVSVFMKLTRHILCGVNKPSPGPGPNLFACAQWCWV